MLQVREDPVVIVGACRTPIGAFQGALKDLKATLLGAHVLKGLKEQLNLAPDDPDDVLMGCVLSAGLGQSPTRQALIHAGLAQSVSATTINKVCGSGLQAVMLAHDLLIAGTRQIILAGGMESMTNAPYLLLPQVRAGLRLGHQKVLDHMMHDGLEDAYQQGCAMGVLAEHTAERYAFTREAQDEFAKNSILKARAAIEREDFTREIIPLAVKAGKNLVTITQDEPPSKPNLDRLSALKPAFKTEGTITAGSSSAIADGAAAVALMRLSEAQRRGLIPLAKIVSHASHSREPQWFTLAPIEALKKVLNQAGWRTAEVDLFEINEAFAAVTMAAIQELALDPAKVNINGGACALGHPIGASGARILVTLLHALRRNQLKRGVASLCIGGGEAVALAIEIIE